MVQRITQIHKQPNKKMNNPLQSSPVPPIMNVQLELDKKLRVLQSSILNDEPHFRNIVEEYKKISGFLDERIVSLYPNLASIKPLQDIRRAILSLIDGLEVEDVRNLRELLDELKSPIQQPTKRLRPDTTATRHVPFDHPVFNGYPNMIRTQDGTGYQLETVSFFQNEEGFLTISCSAPHPLERNLSENVFEVSKITVKDIQRISRVLKDCLDIMLAVYAYGKRHALDVLIETPNITMIHVLLFNNGTNIRKRFDCTFHGDGTLATWNRAGWHFESKMMGFEQEQQKSNSTEHVLSALAE